MLGLSLSFSSLTTMASWWGQRNGITGDNSFSYSTGKRHGLPLSDCSVTSGFTGTREIHVANVHTCIYNSVCNYFKLYCPLWVIVPLSDFRMWLKQTERQSKYHFWGSLLSIENTCHSTVFLVLSIKFHVAAFKPQLNS